MNRRSVKTVLADFLNMEGKKNTKFFMNLGIMPSNAKETEIIDGIKDFNFKVLDISELKGLKRMKFKTKGITEKIEKALVILSSKKETKVAKEAPKSSPRGYPTEPN